eukprot:g2291.t1
MPLYNPLQGKIVGLQRAPQLYQVPSAPGFSQSKESYGVVRPTMGLQSMPRLFTNAQPSLFAPANSLTRQQPNSIVSQTQYAAFLQAQAQKQRLAMMNTMLLQQQQMQHPLQYFKKRMPQMMSGNAKQSTNTAPSTQPVFSYRTHSSSHSSSASDCSTEGYDSPRDYSSSEEKDQSEKTSRKTKSCTKKCCSENNQLTCSINCAAEKCLKAKRRKHLSTEMVIKQFISPKAQNVKRKISSIDQDTPQMTHKRKKISSNPTQNSSRSKTRNASKTKPAKTAAKSSCTKKCCGSSTGVPSCGDEKCGSKPTDASTSPSSSTSSARHVRVACLACSRSKVACSHIRPCPRCVRLGIECVDVRKKRVGQACEGCRKARVACSDGTPCLRCKELGIPCIRKGHYNGKAKGKKTNKKGTAKKKKTKTSKKKNSKAAVKKEVTSKKGATLKRSRKKKETTTHSVAAQALLMMK